MSCIHNTDDPREIRWVLFVLGLVVLIVALASTAGAQTVCTQNCTVQQGEAFTAQWDTNAASGGPTAEYRLYAALGTGTLTVVGRAAVGSPQIVNGVVSFPTPNGIATAGTYTFVLAAANGTTTGAVETRSDPFVLVVQAVQQPPAKPTGGRITIP